MHEPVRSHILITETIDEAYERLREDVKPHRAVGFIKEDFLVEDAKAAIAEAYISEEETKYLILGAKSFNAVSQNALLKVLEEPPRNIEFVLIAPSKSTLLPTIRSRLPMRVQRREHAFEAVELSLASLDLASLFSFVKANDRLKKHDAKALIEVLHHRAAVTEGMTLSARQLEAFERAYRLVELNARMQSVLLMLLMTFLPEPRRAH